MEINHTPESEYEDEQLDGVLSPNTAARAKRHADFEQDLADFEADTKPNSDPLERMIKYVVSDTLTIALICGDAIKEAFPSGAKLEEINRAKGPFNDFFRATRQIERYANLQARFDEGRRHEAEVNRVARPGGGGAVCGARGVSRY